MLQRLSFHRLQRGCAVMTLVSRPGQYENVVDQGEQVPPRAKHPVERLGVLLERLRILPQHLADADDGIERRAQLMAHVREELTFVLACLGELPALVLNFIEQPHVLDGDYRLVGKCGRQLDLLVGERTHLRARQRQHADRHAITEEGHA